MSNTNMNPSSCDSKKCGCNGTCTGYASRTDCPPLIVLAVAAVAAGKQMIDTLRTAIDQPSYVLAGNQPS